MKSGWDMAREQAIALRASLGEALGDIDYLGPTVPEDHATEVRLFQFLNEWIDDGEFPDAPKRAPLEVVYFRDPDLEKVCVMVPDGARLVVFEAGDPTGVLEDGDCAQKFVCNSTGKLPQGAARMTVKQHDELEVISRVTTRWISSDPEDQGDGDYTFVDRATGKAIPGQDEPDFDIHDWVEAEIAKRKEARDA